MKLNNIAEHIRAFPERNETTYTPINRQIWGYDVIYIYSLSKDFMSNDSNVEKFANETNNYGDSSYKSCHTIEQTAKLLDLGPIYEYHRHAAAKIALSVYFKDYDAAMGVIKNFINQTHEEWLETKRAAIIFLKRIGVFTGKPHSLKSKLLQFWQKFT